MRARVVDAHPARAPLEVIVDESHRLHERVDGRRPDKGPAAPLQILAQGN